MINIQTYFIYLIKVSPDETKLYMSKIHKSNEPCPTLSLLGKLIYTIIGSTLEIPKYFPSSLLCFPTNCLKILTHFCSTCATRWKHWKHKTLCICLLLVCMKGMLFLFLDKIGYVSKETRRKFIDSQNFNFHFHYKFFFFVSKRCIYLINYH